MIRSGVPRPARFGPAEQAVQAWDAWTLVAQVQAGDRQAFATLYCRYRPQVIRFVQGRVCHRETAEDIVADTFTRALQAIGRFRWQGADFGSWLVTIAGNLIRDHVRAAGNAREILSGDLGADCGPGVLAERRPGPAELAEVAVAMAAVRSAMAKLVDDQREVLEHRFLADLDVAQTARQMGRGVLAVRSLQYRATRNLRAVVTR